MQKCIKIAKSDEVSNTQLKNMDQTTQEPEDVHKVKMERPKKPERKYPKQTSKIIRTGNPTMTTQATGHVISVGENIVKAEPIAPLGAVFVEHVEKKTTSRPSAEQERKHTMLNLKKTKPARKNSCIV